MSASSDNPRPLHEWTEKELTEHWAATGDQQAASELWRRYLANLVKEASQSRGKAPQSDDSVPGSAFRTFLRQAKTKTFNFDRDDWLWRLLGKIASRKRKSRERKRKREQSGGMLSNLPPPASRAVGPDQAAAYNEARQALLKLLTPREQEWFEGRELGLPQVEIALRMELTTRQVRRITRVVEQKAARLFPLEDTDDSDDDPGKPSD
jgi:DNA-directed RNA polymerase specialized sigma24 family protein